VNDSPSRRPAAQTISFGNVVQVSGSRWRSMGLTAPEGQAIDADHGVRLIQSVANHSGNADAREDRNASID
jgi:hypothetical protein